jgi:glycosyltransferase involved in cell wall biosynthesis
MTINEMATRPLVSILIPCFNAERWIAETLDSALAQTWPNLEIIVVDDGSTDRSAEIVETYADRGVRLIRQANAGASATRNRAFAASNGAFIQFLDHDDFIDPDKVALQVSRLIDSPGSVATAEAGIFIDRPAEAEFRPEPSWRDLEPLDWMRCLLGGCMIFTTIWLIPRGVAEQAGPWNEALSDHDDREYLTRVILAADRVLFCQGARARYRGGNPNSLSQRRNWASTFDSLKLCERHIVGRADDDDLRAGLSLVWQRMAFESYPYSPVIAERALARGRALHAVKLGACGGPRFRMVRAVLGWRAARRLQVMTGRL